MRDAVDAYLNDGGVHALAAHLRESRETIAQFSRMDEDALASALERELDRQRPGVMGSLFNGTRAASVLGTIQSVVNAEVRRGVQTLAISAVREQMAAVSALRGDVDALVEGLRGAEVGTPQGRMAAYLGVRGDAGDHARVRDRIDHSVVELRGFLEHLYGQTWVPTDFPRALDRVARRMGFDPAGDSLGAIAAEPTRREAVETVNTVTTWVSFMTDAEAVAGYLEAGATGMAAVSAGMALGGLWLSHAISEATLENIEHRRAIGRALGL